jgi:hypothetical protein
MSTQQPETVLSRNGEMSELSAREPIEVGRNGVAIGHNPRPLMQGVTAILEHDGRQATADIIGVLASENLSLSIAIARFPGSVTEKGSMRGYALLVGSYSEGTFITQRYAVHKDSCARSINLFIDDDDPRKGFVTVHTSPTANFAFNVMTSNLTDPKLLMSDKTKVVSRPKINGVPLAPENRRTELRRKAAKTAAALMFAATVAPGGVIDQSIAPFIGTDSTVALAAEGMHKIPSPRSVMEIEMAPFEGGLEEYYQSVESDNERIDSAIHVVRDIMRNLDEHNKEAIKSQADTYASAHTEDIFPTERQTAIRDNIEQAKSNDEIMAALQELGSFFDIEVQFSGTEDYGTRSFDLNTPVSDTRRLASAIHEVLSVMPKHFMARTRLRSIELCDFKRSPIPVLGSAEKQQGRLRFSVLPLSDIVGQSIMGGKKISYQEVVRHELTHVAPDIIDVSSVLPDEPTNPFLYLVSRALSYPIDQSMYAAMSDVEEKRAESFANGPEHPDRTRHYLSKANKLALRWLIQSELDDPGSAAYYVTYLYKLSK